MQEVSSWKTFITLLIKKRSKNYSKTVELSTRSPSSKTKWRTNLKGKYFWILNYLIDFATLNFKTSKEPRMPWKCRTPYFVVASWQFNKSAWTFLGRGGQDQTIQWLWWLPCCQAWECAVEGEVSIHPLVDAVEGVSVAVAVPEEELLLEILLPQGETKLPTEWVSNL